jgi:plastocyanin
MGKSIRLFVSFSFILGLAACGDDGGTPARDAATSRDSGGGVDTGTADSGGADGGGDAGSMDSGSADAGGSDSGGADSGPPEGCPLTYSGCTTFEDLTGETTVEVTIVAAGASFAYEPHCIRISAGTTVSIPAEAIHPLDDASCSPETSPLPETPTVVDGDYTFTAAGAYGFFCSVHGSDTGAGMAGLIVVE